MQVCVLDAKRYKDLNPSNQVMSLEGLQSCILDKPLLKWENGSEMAVVSLPLEVGCSRV